MRSFILILCVLPIRLYAQFSEVVIGEQYSLYSNILEEERSYLLSLPKSYEHDDFYVNKHYPVLVLLDGNAHFHTASGIISALSSSETEKIPEMIIVALNNTDRTRDMLPVISADGEISREGGSADLLRFLEDELLPKLDKEYRTLPYRVLVGHSLAGSFTVEAFLKQSSFKAYLAIDPSLHKNENLLVKQAKEVLLTQSDLSASLFIAQANNPFAPGKSTGSRGEAFQTFLSYLENNHAPKLRYSYAFFEDEDHFSVPLISMLEGLAFIFEGYKFPLQSISSSSVADIQAHYQQYAARMHVAIQPPGKLLNQVGLFLLHQENKVEEAIHLFKLNTQYYPDAYIPFQSLAEAYRIHGDHKLALQTYKQALKRNPDDELSKKAMQTLEDI